MFRKKARSRRKTDLGFFNSSRGDPKVRSVQISEKASLLDQLVA